MSGTTSTGGAGSSGAPEVRIEQLLDTFYDGADGFSQLGQFDPVEQLPPPFDRLLDHNEHMTVTVEAFHEQKVDVLVHRCERRDHWYAREITLVGQRSGQVVQYGIVRLDTGALDDHVWRRIESQEAPLGRVLIEHQVLRQVQLCQLWQVTAGDSLAALLEIAPGALVYGRTARIYCDGQPAIELLEVVAPAPTDRTRV